MTGHIPRVSPGSRLGAAKRCNLLQNPHGQLFDGVESFPIVAQVTGGERSEPESNLSRLLGELVHLGCPS